MKLFTFSCALAVCIFASSAYAADPTASDSKNDDNVQLDAVVSIMQHHEAAREAVNLAMAPIKSETDLQNYLIAEHATPSPIDALSPSARQRFLSSLEFNERGISGFDYRDLEAELSPSQIYQVLALFGAQHDAALMKHARIVKPVDRQIIEASWYRIGLGDDHDGYKCDRDNPHSCVEAHGYICTSNC